MAKRKYYVVWKGRKTGIFTSWNECKKQIDRFSDAKYKSFKTRQEAEEAFKEDSYSTQSSKSSPVKSKSGAYTPSSSSIINESISVDASCLGNPGLMEYQGVETASKKILFRCGPFQDGTNNIGEFLAIVHGLAYLQKQGEVQTPIYSDSRTAMAWVRNKKVKTTLKNTDRNDKVFELIDRAIVWLKENNYQNPILKWDTPVWGEIPADFGRK